MSGVIAVGSLARRRWWGLGVVALAQLMIVLDSTVVVIALPSAQGSIGLSTADKQWVVTAYTLTFGGLLLLGGRLGDRLGRRRALLTGVAGFAVASAVGGGAVDPVMLIAARAAQGAFAALLAPSALSLLSTLFSDQRERARAFGAFSITLMAGGAIGQVLGGALTEYLGWRWCFYINLPLAAVVIGGALIALPDLSGRREARLDVRSVLLGCGGLLTLIYAFGEASDYGWGSTRIVAFLIAAAALLGSFAFRQATTALPLLPLRLLTDRNRAGAFIAVAAATGGMLGMFLFMTYQLQTVMHYSALRAGAAFLPYVAAAVTATRAGARLLVRLPPRVVIGPGLVLIAAGLALLTQLNPTSSYIAFILPAVILCGLGMGSIFAPSMNTATSTVEPSEAGIVAAVMNTAQQIGGSIGAALTNTVAATVTATFLATHSSDDPAVHSRATVHGNAVASAWAAAALLCAAVLASALINSRPAKPNPSSDRANSAAPAQTSAGP